jgi:hypothetical protein
MVLRRLRFPSGKESTLIEVYTTTDVFSVSDLQRFTLAAPLIYLGALQPTGNAISRIFVLGSLPENSGNAQKK